MKNISGYPVSKTTVKEQAGKTAMENILVYEQPLDERTRTLLRIENLFNRLNRYSGSLDVQDMRLSISLLIDLNDLLRWSDGKTELTRELERCRSSLSALEGNPGVDSYKLKHVLSDIDDCLATMQDNAFRPGAALDADELITSIRQKSSLAGGICNFDLPAYHHWLNKPVRARQERLKEWQEDFSIIRKSANVALGLVRNNAVSTNETARAGFFQQSIETGVSYRLIRIIMARELKCFPEVSGGKHRVTVRFMEQAETVNRPAQTEDDVEFELHFCVS